MTLLERTETGGVVDQAAAIAAQADELYLSPSRDITDELLTELKKKKFTPIPPREYVYTVKGPYSSNNFDTWKQATEHLAKLKTQFPDFDPDKFKISEFDFVGAAMKLNGTDHPFQDKLRISSRRKEKC